MVVVVVSVVVVVAVVVVTTVVGTVVVVCNARAGPMPATALAVNAPVTTSKANSAPVTSLCFMRLCSRYLRFLWNFFTCAGLLWNFFAAAVVQAPLESPWR